MSAIKDVVGVEITTRAAPPPWKTKCSRERVRAAGRSACPGPAPRDRASARAQGRDKQALLGPRACAKAIAERCEIRKSP